MILHPAVQQMKRFIWLQGTRLCWFIVGPGMLQDSAEQAWQAWMSGDSLKEIFKSKKMQNQIFSDDAKTSAPVESLQGEIFLLWESRGLAWTSAIATMKSCVIPHLIWLSHWLTTIIWEKISRQSSSFHVLLKATHFKVLMTYKLHVVASSHKRKKKKIQAVFSSVFESLANIKP